MSQSEAQPPKRLEIRKYPNRRYYDTTRSCHVTLEQIHALIREGYEVQVVDSKSGQDITPKILAQIIIDLDAPKLGVFPVPMLHRLLQSNQELVSEFVQKYFNQPLSSFLDSQRNMEQYLRQAMGIKNAPPAMSEWTRLMWGPFNPSFWSRGSERPSASEMPPGPAAGSPQQAPETRETELRRQIQALGRQVTRLQAELGKKTPRRKPRKSGR